MYDIAARGDIVLYNEKFKYAPNIYTRELMKQYLKVDNYYKILEVSKSKEEGKYFYRFKVGTNYDFWCPYQSFDRDYESNRNLLIEKYNLR